MLIYQRFIDYLLEAIPGFEPGFKVLQTHALTPWLYRLIFNIYDFYLKLFSLLRKS